jgi:hypothetical protein
MMKDKNADDVISNHQEKNNDRQRSPLRSLGGVFFTHSDIRSIGAVHERFAVLNNGLRRQGIRFRFRAGHFFDRRADGQKLHQAAAQVIDARFNADHFVGAKAFGVLLDARQRFLARFVKELREPLDFSAAQALQRG